LFKKKIAIFAKAKVFLRIYWSLILSLYDLLNGDGVSGRNLSKKSVYWRCVLTIGTSNTQICHQNIVTIDAILYVDMHTNSPNRFLLWRVLV